jgi:hypothetical protein
MRLILLSKTKHTDGATIAIAHGATAFGLGVGSAISETGQYLTNQSGTNTDIDPNQSLMPQDMKGHWGWVVASWVGAGLGEISNRRVYPLSVVEHLDPFCNDRSGDRFCREDPGMGQLGFECPKKAFSHC